MELLLSPLLLFGLLLMAPFIALNAYIVTWLCGPAIRHAGKCFEQGRQRAGVVSVRELQPLAAPWQSRPQVVAGPSIPAPKPDPQYTADQPATPDSGHRWLGNPRGKSA